MQRKNYSSRFIFFALFVLLCGCSFAFSQKRNGNGWIWQNPLPQGNSLSAIHFAKDKENGLAVGADGTILRTEDGGFNWKPQFAPVVTNLYGVFVRDKARAVAVGTRGVILLTENGGKDWREAKTDARDHLHGVAFAGENFSSGWAVGTYGRVLRTTDGGMTWTNQTSGTTEHLLKVSFLNQTDGAAVGANGTILTTKNSGVTWKKDTPCAGLAMTGAVFLTKEKIVAAGHEIGNHSFSHRRMVLVSPGFVKSEIEKTDDLIKKAGYAKEITFRPPYSKKLFVLPWYLSENSRKTVTCDVEPETYAEMSGDIIKHTLENTGNGSIILLHVM